MSNGVHLRATVETDAGPIHLTNEEGDLKIDWSDTDTDSFAAAIDEQDLAEALHRLELHEPS
jgi:hypothetical protein